MMNIRHKGFTLIEMIVSMVIVAILAAGLVLFLRPALLNYLSVGQRAALSDQADGAMRLMMRDIRLAVPNSMRDASDAAGACFELVPAEDGGRFRTALDPVSANSQPLDATNPGAIFDALMPQSPAPAVGDWVVIGNQNAADLYGGASRSQIAAVAAPPAPNAGAYPYGSYRITLTGKAAIPAGYDGARFQVVPNARQAVMYSCSAGLVNGNGTGQLRRYSGYGFKPALNGCAAPLVGATNTPAKASAVASNVAACTMNYDPNPGATQGSGYMAITLTLSVGGEAVTLSYGAHAANVP